MQGRNRLLDARDSLRHNLKTCVRRWRPRKAGCAITKQQLADTQKRLKLLENEGKIAETIVHSYGPSVCLLHVVVEFLDKATGKPIQIAVDRVGQTAGG